MKLNSVSQIKPKSDHLGCLFIVYHTTNKEYMYNKQMIKILIMEEDEDFNLVTNIPLQTGQDLKFRYLGECIGSPRFYGEHRILLQWNFLIIYRT